MNACDFVTRNPFEYGDYYMRCFFCDGCLAETIKNRIAFGEMLFEPEIVDCEFPCCRCGSTQM